MPGWLKFAIALAVLAVVATIVWRTYKAKCRREIDAEQRRIADVIAAEERRVADKAAAEEARRKEEEANPRSYRGSGYGSSSTYEPVFVPPTLDEFKSPSKDFAKIAGIVAIAFWTLTAFALIMASTVVVSTKNVGVVTSFGRPTGSLDNGFHVILPWEKVTELDGAIQTDSHVGTGKCTTVRIAHQSTACVDNSIRWRIRHDSSDGLFRDYKDFDNIRDSLVTRELGAALNTVFKDYDPLATDENGNSTSVSQDFLSQQTTKLLQAQIGGDIDVLNVIVPIVHFDDDTQKRINALQAEVANTRIAKQKKLTADQTALANKALADSVSRDPNVLVSNCFDILADMVKNKQPVPAGFSCWPGGSSAVVVPSK